MSGDEADVITMIAAVRERVAAARAAGRRVALVPTMGALHEGHLALADRARAEGGLVVVSVFVNPLQFGAGEDLDRYPRTLAADVAALGDRADVVFAPTAAEMYPEGAATTRVTGGEVAESFEGASRPGHFDGVLTVVAKLLGIVQPDVVVFGRKDAQQVFLVARMVRDLDLPVEVVVVDTVREADGLALSSRNRYLSADERTLALTLSRALGAARETGATPVGRALDAAGAVLVRESAVAVDYLAAVAPETFEAVGPAEERDVLMVVAARVGSTRLIDNERVSPRR